MLHKVRLVKGDEKVPKVRRSKKTKVTVELDSSVIAIMGQVMGLENSTDADILQKFLNKTFSK